MADRLAAAGGAVFALASVAAGASLPPPPSADASAAGIRSYLADHHAALTAASLVSAAAALALLVFVTGLSRRSAGHASALVAAAGTVTVTVAVLGGLLQAAAAQVLPRLQDDGAVVGLFTVERVVFYDAPAVSMALVFLAAAAALPRWLGAAGAAVAVLGLVDGLGDAGSRGGFPGALGLTGFLATVLWVAAASWTLWREDGAHLPVAAPVAATA